VGKIMINKNVQRFGVINTIEGYSYLALLFIAMPLKYYFDMPLAVKYAGMIHGVLFVSLILLMIPAYLGAKWKFKCNILFFIASLIPFGTFYTRGKIQTYE
jgi:integral membrane protein